MKHHRNDRHHGHIPQLPRQLFYSTLWLSLLTTQLTADSLERIDPAGLPGNLILCGNNFSDEVLEAFANLAYAEDSGRVVVIRAGHSEQASGTTGRIVADWETRSSANLSIIRVDESLSEFSGEDLRQLQVATGIWLVGESSQSNHPAVANSNLREEILNALKRDCVLAFSDMNFEQVSGRARSESPVPSLSLCSDVIFEQLSETNDSTQRLADRLADSPDHVAISIEPTAGLFIRRRHIAAVGNGKVIAQLAGTANKDQQTFELSPNESLVDLVGLRRAARDRVGPKFPPDVANDPIVENGTLIIIGGGGMPNGIIERFVELAGGEEASIVVLPTAMPDPLPDDDRIGGAFRRAGAKEVTVLTGRTLDQVESDEYLDAFSRATGIWFGGGRQWRFADAYLDTKALPLMHAVLQKGGVIMGSSAGASIQAEYLARSTPIGNSEPMSNGYERGLGFLPGAAIDQHFAQRRRFPDMTRLVGRYPQLLGIGIDEATAIIVEKEIAEVVGRGAAHFYDAAKPVGEDGKDYESVYAAGSYNLVTRDVIEAGNVPDSSADESDSPTSDASTMTRAERVEAYTEAIFGRLDKDDDDQLSTDELADQRRRIPDQVDQNGDGLVSRSELRIWLQENGRE